MVAELINIIFPTLICICVGFIWAKFGKKYDTEFIGQLTMYVGAPCLIISNFSQIDIKGTLIFDVAWAAVGVIGTTGLIAWTGLKIFKMDRRIYLPPLMFSNVGNMGLPLCLFAFGKEGLTLGLSYFLVGSIAFFTIGITLISGKFSIRKIIFSPIIQAAIISVIISFFGLKTPIWIDRSINLLSNITIPLMLLTLGVSLASLKVTLFKRSLLFATLRVSLGFCIGFLVSTLLNLTGAARGVVIIHSSMSVPVFNYLLAHHYKRAPEEIAGMVVLSTLIVFCVLPFIFMLIL